MTGPGEDGEREELTKGLDVVEVLVGGFLPDPVDLQEILLVDHAGDAAVGRANRLGGCVRVRNISKEGLGGARDTRTHPFW